MGIRPQNMPQTLNSLLSPAKFMVARGNHLHAPLPTPLHVPPLHTLSVYPFCVPLCVPPPHTPLHTPSAYPSAYPLHVPE